LRQSSHGVLDSVRNSGFDKRCGTAQTSWTKRPPAAHRCPRDVPEHLEPGGPQMLHPCRCGVGQIEAAETYREVRRAVQFSFQPEAVPEAVAQKSKHRRDRNTHRRVGVNAETFPSPLRTRGATRRCFVPGSKNEAAQDSER
jgi:hypothetical protein